MKRLYHSCIIAFSMFSKIPMPRCDWDQENMAYMMCFFPWVGAVIGGVLYAWGTVGFHLQFHGILFPAIFVMIPLVITGGIHLDGFLDTTDALSAWMPREKRLEILKDVHVGAFAVIYAVAYLLLFFAACSEITETTLPLICMAFPLGRTLSGLSIVSFPKAKKDGTVSTFAKDAATNRVRVVLVVYLVICCGGILLLHPILGGLQIFTAAMVFFWYYKKAMKYFGGVTGDIAGYFLSICELAMLLVVVIAGILLM